MGGQLDTDRKRLGFVIMRRVGWYYVREKRRGNCIDKGAAVETASMMKVFMIRMGLELLLPEASLPPADLQDLARLLALPGQCDQASVAPTRN